MEHLRAQHPVRRRRRVPERRGSERRRYALHCPSSRDDIPSSSTSVLTAPAFTLCCLATQSCNAVFYFARGPNSAADLRLQGRARARSSRARRRSRSAAGSGPTPGTYPATSGAHLHGGCLHLIFRLFTFNL